MNKPECRNCGTGLEHEFAKCPKCDQTKVVSSAGPINYETLQRVSTGSQLQQEALARIFKTTSIPFDDLHFSERERDEISKNIYALQKDIIKVDNLSTELQIKIKSDLEYLNEELKSQKRRTWKNILIGIAVQWLREGSLKLETVEKIYNGIMDIVLDAVKTLSES